MRVRGGRAGGGRRGVGAGMAEARPGSGERGSLGTGGCGAGLRGWVGAVKEGSRARSPAVPAGRQWRRGGRRRTLTGRRARAEAAPVAVPRPGPALPAETRRVCIAQNGRARLCRRAPEEEFYPGRNVLAPGV